MSVPHKPSSRVPGAADDALTGENTERKRAEEALRESQALYHSLVEQMPAGVFRKDAEGRYVFVNSWFCRLKGVKAELFLGKKPREVAAVELAAKVADPSQINRLADQGADHHQQIMQTGQKIEVEERGVGPDGKEQYLHVVKSPIFGPDGKIVGSQGIMFDITDRKRAEEVVHESRALYHSFVEQLPAAAFRKDRDGRYVMVNSRFCELKGVKAEHFLGKTAMEVAALEEILQGDEGQATKYATAGDQAHTQIMRTGKIIESDEEYTAADGRKQFYHVVRMPVFGSDGKVVGTQGILFDVTQSKEAESALQESQAGLESAQSIARMGNWELHLESGKGRWSKEMFRLFDRDPALGEPKFEEFLATVHPEDRAHLSAAQSRVVESGVQCQAEFRSNPDRGPVRHFIAIIQAVRETSGAVRRIAGTVQDITERKLTEARLREQSAMLDAANDAIYVCTLDYTVTYWNDGAERLYGWRRTEAIGRKIDQLIGGDQKAFAMAYEALLQQGNWSGELKTSSKAKKEYTVFCRWTMLRDEQGRPKEILAINTDITERKQLEANFLRAQRMEGIGALAGGIAHDLNNILQPILMAAPLLDEVASDPETRAILATVRTCAQRGADIIKQLLTFARGKPGARVPMPVRHLINDMEKILRETFPRNIQLIVDAPKNLWPVLGDPTQIHQALMNLCVNARDAMPNGGKLSLEAKNLTVDGTLAAEVPDAKPGQYVCLSATDTGTGIAPEHLDRIFDPFFTTKELGKGTGLGLATVLGIVRGHDGFIRVNSRLGHGTTFELYLPASPEVKTLNAPERPVLPPPANGELILVVDDEAPVRGLIQRTLEKHGYRIRTAAEGSEAMAFFTEHRAEIKAVITDLMMPGMDGPSLIRTLRQLDPYLPILSMTGLGEQAEVKGIQKLNLPLLLKPFARGELLGALHRTMISGRELNGMAN